MQTTIFEYVASSQLIQIPVLGIYILGLILSLVRWKRHPKISALMLAAMIILLSVSIASIALHDWLFFIYRPGSHAGFARYRLVSSIVAVTANLAHTVGLSLWVAAVFMLRTEGQRGFAVQAVVGSPPDGTPPPLPQTWR